MSNYYVYALIDPRNDSVFYIGKGKKNRMHHHEKEAMRGVHSRKCDLIREILDQKLELKKQIVKTFVDEVEAYAFEKQLIEEIGLDRLTNVIAGGGGIPEHKIKESQPSVKDWLRAMLVRPAYTAQWFMNNQKSVTVEYTDSWAAKVHAWILESFFNTLLPRAFEEIKKDRAALGKLEKAMRGYGIEFTYT
jgi:hypothetical protein